MRLVMQLRCIAALFAVTALATSFNDRIEERATPDRIPPTKDPFYTPPTGFESAKPGAILRHRTIADAATVFGDPIFGAAYQLLYRTTSSIGHPQAAVTTVFVPAKGVKNSKHLSYQIPYDSAFINCDPSYTLRRGTRKAFLSNEDLLSMSAALHQGWYVSTPDYEGPRAAYTSGPQAAYGTLDAVRAVLASHSITGIHSDQSQVDNVLWGYSGGALASEWALEFQPSYAPELRFVGAALGGLTPNITSVFHTINRGIFAGLAGGGIIGLSRAYPNMSKYLQENLVPKTKDEFLMAGKQCYLKDIKEFFAKNMLRYFKNGDQLFTDPVPKSIIQIAGIMGIHGVPKAPLYAYKAIKDEISVIADTDALVHKFCKKGVDITYERNKVGEHVENGALGLPEAFTFLVARMNGDPLPKGCNISTVDTGKTLAKKYETILTPTVWKALNKIVTAQFKAGV